MATKPQPAPKGKMRYENNELGIIKSTFSENPAILLALRKVFFQAELSKADLEILKPIKSNKAVQELIRKTYLPEVELDSPIGQVIDLWLTVDSKDKTPMESALALKVRSRLMELIEAGLIRLESDKTDATEIVIDWKPDYSLEDEELYVNWTARNAIITHSEFQLSQLMVLAQKKDETPEETKKRIAMNSTR